MSKRKLKQSQEKCNTLFFKSSALKDALQGFVANEGDVITHLKDIVVKESIDIRKVINVFRKLIDKLSCDSISNEQCELVLSVVISVLEHKQLRQLASKLILAIAQNYNNDFNEVIIRKAFITAENLMFMILYCGESIKYLKQDVLKPFWEEYFRVKLLMSSDIEENRFIFGCRAFNAYVVAIEKSHGQSSEQHIVNQDTFKLLVKFASNRRLNRDCRQVIGLICLTLKTISSGSHQHAYIELLNQSFETSESEDVNLDLEFYRFILSYSMVTKIKEFKGTRDVLYEKVLDHSLNLALRTDIDKLFSISVFKSVNMFLESVLSEADTAALHSYPDDLERQDPLSVDKIMLNPDSQYVHRLLALVQVHWNNKLEAVRRIVSQIHNNLIHLVTELSGEEAARSFLKNQVKDLLSLSWNVHGKYQALSQLIPIIGTPTVLQIEPRLPSKILEILSSDIRLASYCASLYYTLYKHDVTALSTEVWLDPLTQHLENPFVADLCLRPILEVDEGSLSFLRDRLVAQNRTEGLVRVLREGRRLGLLDIKFVDSPDMFTKNQDNLFGIHLTKIKDLCDSCDDCKVLGVLGLICETNKTALPMSATELELMSYIIKTNQVRQVPAFRKHLFDNVDKFLSRLNLSCPILEKMVKNRYTEDDELVSDKASEMLELYSGFVSTCTADCYEHLIPAASFQRQVTVIGILEKFYSILSCSKLECLEDTIALNLHKLISAIASSFESVRNSSLVCVSTITSIPRDSFLSTMTKVMRNLTSPKGVLSLGSNALFSFVISRSLEQPGFDPWDVVKKESTYGDIYFKDLCREDSVLIQWICGFFNIIDFQIEKAEGNLMDASRNFPIFPAFNLLEVAFRVGNLKAILSSAEQKKVISKLLNYSTRLTQLFHQPIVDESPEGLLLLGSVESGGSSCGPQLLMSMTWRSMQSLCSCLVAMVACAITTPEEDTHIGLYLRDLLLSVRHHGVFEKVHSAFISFCATAWTRQKEDLLSWLEEVLCRVETSEDDMSYTRRSAGKPSVIQAILVTEPARKGKPLLRTTMDRLLRLAVNPALLTGRIHALNILHVLFKDSKLAEFVVPYIGPAFEMSIKGFSEKLWPLRNASTMIFTILMTRLFTNRHNSSKQTTDAAFFTLFPNLHPYFVSELSRAAADEKCLYYPSLYPILIILQRLTPCPVSFGDPCLSLSHFTDIIRKFSLSGVFKTRSLAGEALASIMPPADSQAFVLKQISVLETTMKQNELHGTLLQVKHSLQNCSDSHAILLQLSLKFCLLTDNACPYTAALYISTVTEVICTIEDVITPEGVPNLTKLVDESFKVIKHGQSAGAMSTLRDACLAFILSLKSKDLTTALLLLGSREVMERVFEAPDLHTWYDVSIEGMYKWYDVTQEGMCDPPILPLNGVLHVFKGGLATREFESTVYSNVISVLQSDCSPKNQSKALEVLAHISHIPDKQAALLILVPLCSSLSPWEHRLLLPGCLNNIYSSLSQQDHEVIELKSSTLFCLVNLLQDDDDEVRRSSSAVILNIINHTKRDTAPELVLPLLLPFLLSLSPEWVLPLLDWVVQSDVQELITSHYSDQYKSEGYAAVSRDLPLKGDIVSTTSCNHPLFEPDLVNSFAEPLCVPNAVRLSFAELKSYPCNVDSLMIALRQKSRQIYEDYCEKVGVINDDIVSVRDFVFFSKVQIVGECIIKASNVFGMDVIEDWNLLIDLVKSR